jgi:hypothetical protein
MSMRHAVVVHAAVAACTVAAIAFSQSGSADAQNDRDRANQNQNENAPTAKQLPAAHPLAGMDLADQQEMMAKWAKAGEITATHEWLHRMVGEWDIEQKVWMDQPGEPMVTTASATVTKVLGGRFIKQDFEGSFMGEPMSGLGLTGYDTTRKLFVGSWMDSFSTGMHTMTGSMHMDGEGMSLFGQMYDVATGEVGKMTRYDIRFIDSNTHVFSAYEIMYGEPMKVMEMTYSRK